MSALIQSLKSLDSESNEFRLTDFPMHYFAAIQRRNQINLGRTLESIGLTPMEWRILAALHGRKKMAIGDLAEVTVLDRFKIGRCLGRLIANGLVEEIPSSRDKRKKRSTLTPAGIAKFKEAAALVSQVYLANFEGLSEDEMSTLMSLLRRIKDNVFRAEEY